MTCVSQNSHRDRTRFIRWPRNRNEGAPRQRKSHANSEGRNHETTSLQKLPGSKINNATPTEGHVPEGHKSQVTCKARTKVVRTGMKQQYPQDGNVSWQGLYQQEKPPGNRKPNSKASPVWPKKPDQTAMWRMLEGQEKKGGETEEQIKSERGAIVMPTVLI